MVVAKNSARDSSVGRKQPNAWGRSHMHGNVGEWCADWYDSGYYAGSPTDDPIGPATASYHVVRGGGWGNEPNCCSAARGGTGPGDRGDDLGLRVACVPAEPSAVKPKRCRRKSPRRSQRRSLKKRPSRHRPPWSPSLQSRRPPPRNRRKPSPSLSPTCRNGRLAGLAQGRRCRRRHAPVSLGKVHLEPDATLEVKLVGGDVVCKSNPCFTLTGKEGAAAGPWVVQAVKNEGGAGVDVAEISLNPQQELAFRWLKGANGRAACLRNCGLDLSAGGETRFLPLRPVVNVEPLSLSENGKSEVSLKAEASPDPAAVRLEITEKRPGRPVPA